MVTTTERFAYGDDEIRGISCPATTKTFQKTPGNAVVLVADAYDDIAQKKKGRGEGTIPADDAKEWWKKAIQRVESEDRDGPSCKKVAVEEAKQVQEDLGWD